MSEKYLIGLTGNIATGKSIVLRMLQELGASVIDADQETHRLQRRGTPAYDKIVRKFGTFVLDRENEIDRRRLANIVFNDPDAMTALEQIVHPAVRKRIERLIEGATTPVVAIEAIKLIEGGLAGICDAIWVVTTPEDVQLHRLQTRRKMTAHQALQRINAQPPQEEKIELADVVIDNSGNVIRAWNTVKRHYQAISSVIAPPEPAPAPAAVQPVPAERFEVDLNKLVLRRAKPADLAKMTAFVNAVIDGENRRDENQMMEHLFSRGYTLAEQNKRLLGLAGYQTENFIAGIDDFHVLQEDLWPTVGEALLNRVHEAVAELSCEVALVFLPPEVGSAHAVLVKNGYERKNREDLIRMWREAAVAWQQEGTVLFVKQLLERRIMTPL
jgi:dephospho-CoA kinase